VSPSLAAIALNLYKKEELGEIQDDGLERGYDSIVFITELLESRQFLEKLFDLRSLGMACQVVDDVLDCESDFAANQLNCLATPRWRQHIDFMRAELAPRRMRPLFAKSRVLKIAVERAIQKGEKFLRVGLPSLERSSLLRSAEFPQPRHG